MNLVTRDWSQQEQIISEIKEEWCSLDVTSTWEVRYQAIRDEQHELRKEGRWVGGPRDLLGVLQKSHHEMSHSAIVAWLLDPRMRHGLGDRFLSRLLTRCFPKFDAGDLSEAKTQTEVARGQGRADIVVWGERFTLIIENKVDAPEGDGQCEYYFRVFSDEENPLFVFLTPEARSPDLKSAEALKAYRVLSYADIVRDLEACLQSSRHGKSGEARGVAERYVQTLSRDLVKRDRRSM